jgi:choline dehydrogenase
MVDMPIVTSPLRSYDFIVCGAGTSGSVVARRLAENPAVSVLLVEAGGTDQVPTVTAAGQWPLNLGSERDWGFSAVPSAHVNGRAVPLSMGKVLGGGSSINLMVWARGHKADWDHFAFESGDKGWGYESVLDIYRRIEDFHGNPDPDYRGTGGPVYVIPAPDPNPLAPATIEAARAVGIPTFENQNGRMMEHPTGASISDIRARAGRRQSVFGSYVAPVLHQPNLSVITAALVTRVSLDGTRATGVELLHGGQQHHITARTEVILSLGAIHTPKVLLHSGIGDESELRRVGIPRTRMDAVRRRGPAQEPRPPSVAIGQSTRLGRHPGKHAVPPRRRQSRRRGCPTMPGDRKLGTPAAIRQTRGHAGQPRGRGAGTFRPRRRVELLAPNVYCQDGPRRDVRRRRSPQRLRPTRP